MELIIDTCTIRLTKHKDGFWLYDFTRGMNLAMRATSKQEAFVEALTYYQTILKQIEIEHKTLSSKVEMFVNQFTDDES